MGGVAPTKLLAGVAAGLTSYVGMDSKRVKAENIVTLLRKLCLGESMCLIQYGFSSSIQFSSLYIPDSLMYL